MGDSKQYKDFVREYRKKYGLTMNQVCYGICDRTNYSKFEAGNSNLSPAKEERLLERLGICTDDFYKLVAVDVYNRWLEKQEIVYKIILRDLNTAEKLLEEFAQKGFEKESFEEQFYYRMISFVGMCKGSKKETIADNLKRCLDCTLPDFSIDRMKSYAVSILEIDTFLDYLFYSDDMIEEHYLTVMKYITQERFNIKARAVILAKAVHYYLTIKKRKVPVEVWYQSDLDYAIDWLEKAVSYARVKNSSSYLYELLQWREILLGKKKLYDQNKKWDEMLQNCIDWKNALKDVADFAKRDVMTVDTAHIYSSTNVVSINEIIRRRKKMFQFTNEEIAEGICNHKTIERAIRDESTPTKYYAMQILDRLNYSNRLNGNCINAESLEGMIRSERFRHYINTHDIEKSKTLLEKIRQSFHNYNTYNEQFLLGWDAYIKFRGGELTEIEYAEQMKKAIESTVSLDCIYNAGMVSLSIYEIQFFNQYVKRISERYLEMPLRVLVSMTNEWLGKSYELAQRTGLFLLVETVQNRLGDLGYHELSKEYSFKGIQMVMNTRQLSEIAGMFYNIWWNNNEEHRTIDKDPEGCIRQLSLCMSLAHLINNEEDYFFYRNKIEFITDLYQYQNFYQNQSNGKLLEWIDLIQLQNQ